MKYLDEQIEIIFEDLNILSSGTFQYRVIDDVDGKYIFVGNTFIEAGTGITKTFNITDIVSNYSYINKAISDNDTHRDPVIKTYSIELDLGGAIYTETSDEIYLAYRYPHLLKRLELNEGNLQYNIQPGLVPVYPSNYSNNYGFNFNVLTKGAGQKVFNIEYSHNDKYGIKDILSESGLVNISKSIKLSDLEDYPIPATVIPTTWTLYGHIDEIDEKTFIWEEPRELLIQAETYEGHTFMLGTIILYGEQEYKTYEFETDVHNIRVIYIDAEDDYAGIESDDLNTGEHKAVIRLTLERAADPHYEITSNITILKYDKKIDDGITLKVNNDKIKIGEFCDKLDGYYLQWQDRLGSLQSQHFEGNPKFSIDYETTSITNYRGEKRNINTYVTSKWEINSGWINENNYPYYESIFVSPYLKLYDVKEDKSYDVVVTDSSYEEKTFHNQGRQLFNLTLNLEKNTQQNILY